jgi:precorrin-2 dehydrogenase / sirohydrochlorin ferrochelatase
VALKATPQIIAWHKKKKVRLTQRLFRPADLDNTLLVVAATNSPKLHRAIYREARKRHVLCNIVDVPELCDFYYPAVVRRGQLQIAISTAGASPSLARRLREEMESTFGPEYAAWLTHLSQERQKLMKKKLPFAERLEILKQQASQDGFSQFLRQESSGKRAFRKS